MSLEVVNGNLLESDCAVMAHQCNCFSTMGAGIAKQFAQKWPAVANADKNFMPKDSTGKLGKCSSALVANDKVLVYNLYGQYNYGRGTQQTNYDALEKSLRMMIDELKQLGNLFYKLKIGVPYAMGCGLAGGDWNVVSGILTKVSDEHGIKIYAYKL